MKKVISFNGNWSFRKGFFDPEGIASVKVNWEKVDLPHTWNALDGQDGGGDYYRGLGCYISCATRRTAISPLKWLPN